MIKTKKQDRVPGIIISAVLFCAEMAFIVLLLYTKLISVKYIGVICVACISATCVFTCAKSKKKDTFYHWSCTFSSDISSVGNRKSVYL